MTVIAPIVEEFFFRGFFFGALRNWHGVWPAALITGVVFGCIHVGSAPIGFLVPLAFLGFILCLVYAEDGIALSVRRAARPQQRDRVRRSRDGLAAWQIPAAPGRRLAVDDARVRRAAATRRAAAPDARPLI